MRSIAGTINWLGNSTLEQMLNVQIHRGPDDQSTWLGILPDQRTIGLGSRRLAIQALFKAGHMPMRSPSADLPWPTTVNFIPHRPEQQLAEELRERFSSAVKSQLISDVPVGTFLSADLGSSSIVTCMARHVSEPINIYTNTFPKHYRFGNC